MTLNEMIQSDVTDLFLNTDDFGETVVRFRGGKDGVRESITAIVTLEETEFRDDRGRKLNSSLRLSLTRRDTTVAFIPYGIGTSSTFI